MEEPDFLLDIAKEEDIRKIQEITKIVSQKPIKYNPNAVFLRKFFIAAYRVGRIIHEAEQKPKVEIKKEVPTVKQFKPAEKIEIKVQQPKVPSPIAPPKPIVKAEEKPLEAPLPKFLEYPLVVVKETNAVLARAMIKDSDYILSEPILSQTDFEILNEVKNDLAKKIAKDPKILDSKDYLISRIKPRTDKAKVNLDNDYFEKIRYYLTRDIAGLGRIDALLKDNNVKEIYCDGKEKPLIVMHDDKRLTSNILYESEKEIEDILEKFISLSGQKIPVDQPFVDLKLQIGEIKITRGLGIISSKFSIKK